MTHLFVSDHFLHYYMFLWSFPAMPHISMAPSCYAKCFYNYFLPYHMFLLLQPAITRMPWSFHVITISCHATPLYDHFLTCHTFLKLLPTIKNTQRPLPDSHMLLWPLPDMPYASMTISCIDTRFYDYFLPFHIFQCQISVIPHISMATS